ncbi:MAG TPA: MOSC domain-containing protein [Gaiellaceae bacterium]|nr:MOSC domain-containing protein [Gaiellaceae bacterium]
MSTDLHVPRESLDPHMAALRSLSTDAGTLELIVVRPVEGERETPETGELTIEEGLVGDRWQPRMDADGRPDRHNQLTIASSRLLELIAETDRWPLAGDNLVVDMGLDKESLPAGTRLQIGDTAIVEISEEPHTGCAKFSARFGSDALKFINSPEGRELRLRGTNARVIVPGTVSTGDAVKRIWL